MAVKRYILTHRNDSGVVDTVHFQTDSDSVLRPDDSTVEAALSALKTDVQKAQQTADTAAGVAESGLPSGGTTGQIITKKTDTDYDAEWADCNFLSTEDPSCTGALKISTKSDIYNTERAVFTGAALRIDGTDSDVYGIGCLYLGDDGYSSGKQNLVIGRSFIVSTNNNTTYKITNIDDRDAGIVTLNKSLAPDLETYKMYHNPLTIVTVLSYDSNGLPVVYNTHIDATEIDFVNNKVNLSRESVGAKLRSDSTYVPQFLFMYETSTTSNSNHAYNSIAAGSGHFNMASMSYNFGASNMIIPKCTNPDAIRLEVLECSCAIGEGLRVAKSHQTVIGKFNNMSDASNDRFIVGSGTKTTARSNCFRIANTASYGVGAHNTTGADYAEQFEWMDDNPSNEDRIGCFVTLDGTKIQFATSIGDFILGITSGNPSIIGDSYDDQWQGMYETDIYGRFIWEDVTIPAEYDEDGVVISDEHVESQLKVNPNYNPSEAYIPRSKRPEWATVGMMGKLVLIDDGTCVVNGYAKPTTGGIGTKSDTQTKFRVMERLDDTHVRVLIL